MAGTVRLLEEMCRCWRLLSDFYANEFHLDITPSVPNMACVNGGELVPDEDLRTWKASNPRGFKALFRSPRSASAAASIAKGSAFVRRGDSCLD